MGVTENREYDIKYVPTKLYTNDKFTECDKVFDMRYGIGKIIHINTNPLVQYPIVVIFDYLSEFDKDIIEVRYTKDGKSNIRGYNPTLSKSVYKVENFGKEPKPKSAFEKEKYRY